MTLWTPWAAGQRITAGKLNSMVGEWTPYSPLWTNDAGTATTVGAGTLIGKYQRVGNTIHYRVMLQWGSGTSAGTSASNWHFSLPVLPWSGDGTTFWPGNTWLLSQESSTARRWLGGCYVDPPSGTLSTITTNAESRYLDNTTWPTSTAPSTTSLVPGTKSVAAGDRINFWGSYEAAE